MIKRLYFFILTLAFLFVKPSITHAIENPAERPNNKFGIHIIDENDLEDAANLVNSKGGEWGYITMVIREDEKNLKRWQQVFNKINNLKLIPLVRIATTMNQSGNWEKPKAEESKKWANFLNELPWPTKNKYVILFNEPNHKKEWGNEISPEEYAKISRIYWEEFKKESDDFFVLPAGFDLSAPDSNETMKVENYFRAMYEFDNLIFTIFDGWTSHSYPNPDFCGSPNDSGKNSVRGFLWELNFLKNFNLPQDIPIFITETGWGCSKADYPSYLEQAFEKAWQDKQIIAVTPFVLNYNSHPFKQFSWKNPDGSYKPVYNEIIKIPKIKGDPKKPETIKKRKKIKNKPLLPELILYEVVDTRILPNFLYPSLKLG